METQNITQQEYEDIVSINPQADDSNLLVLPEDKNVIKEKTIETEVANNPQIADALQKPDGDRDKIIADSIIDKKTTEAFYEQYYNGMAYNKGRLFAKMYNDSIMKRPNKKMFEELGFESMQEMVQAIKPKVLADNTFTRRNFSDNPFNVFVDISKPTETPLPFSEMTTLVGGTWSIPNFFTAEKVARDKGYVLGSNGEQIPLSDINKFDLVEIAYDDLNGYHYKKGRWDELSTNNVRSIFGTQYGDDPNLIATATMGILNGSLGKGASGLGYLAGLLGANDARNVLFNIGRSFNYTSKGIEDEFSLQNIFYYVGDGIGQMVPVMLGMKHMPSTLISRFGMTQQQAFNASLWTTRIFMGAEAAGSVQDMLIKMGVPENEAMMHGSVSGFYAGLSESIIPGNWVEKMAYTNKFKDGVIRNTFVDAMAKKGITATTNAGKSATVRSNMRRFFANMDNPYIHAVLAPIEEMGEEVFENILNSSTANMQNGMMFKNAIDRQTLYNGSSWYESNGRYYVKYNDNTIQELSKEDWETRQREWERTGLMLQNDELLSSEVDFKEAVYAGLSTAIVSAFGLPANISQQKQAKKMQNANVSLAMLAKHISMKPEGRQEVLDMLQEYKANGALAKYHVDKDGNPATTGTDRMVADDLIDAFMAELDLMAQSMKVYGMESRDAIQAYEGDIEFFTKITDVVTKMERINNAINNGIADNLHEGLIKEDDTVDTLKEKLDGLSKVYEHLAIPKQGNKHSDAYNKKLQEIYIRNAVLENRYINEISKNLYDKDFTLLTDEEKQKVRAKVEMIKFTAANTPGFVDDINKKYHAGILAHGGHENLIDIYHAISDAMYGNKNQQSELAKRVFEKHNNILESKKVVKSEDELSKLTSDIESSIGKISQIRGKTSTEKIDITEDIAKVVSQELSSLMQNYDIAMASSRAGMDVSKSFGKIKSMIKSLKGDIKNISGSVDAFEVIEKSVEITTLNDMASGFEKLTSINPDTFELGTMEMGYVDTENMTPEHVDIALKEFAKNPIENMLYSSKNSMLSIGGMYNEFMGMTEGDNVQNASGFAQQGKSLLSLFEAYNDFLLVEDEVIPLMEQDEKAKEASPKRETPSRSLTKEELTSIKDTVSLSTSQLKDRIGALEGMEPLRAFGQNKRHIADIWESYNILKAVQQTVDTSMSEKDFKIIDNVVTTMIDEVHTRLKQHNTGKEVDEQFKDIHSNDPFSYVYGTFIKSNNKDESVMELVHDLEKIILKAADQLSGKLDNYIEIYMRFNGLYDTSFVSPLSNEDYQGKKAFDFIGNRINTNNEYLINPSNVPGDFHTKYSINGDDYVTSTAHWQILSKLDMINEMGRDGAPSMKDIYSAFADVMDMAAKYVEESMQSGSMHKLNLHTPTYEQRQVIMEMIVNAYRKDKGIIYEHGNKHSDIVKNSIYLRGYAGGGKTSVVTPFYMMTMAKLKEQRTGIKEFNVQVYGPTNNLIKGLETGSILWVEEIMKLMGLELNIRFSVYKNDGKKTSYKDSLQPTADVVIIDEATKMGNSQSGNEISDFTAEGLYLNLKKFRESNPTSNTHFVLIGDDSQVSINEIQPMTTVKPITSYFAKSKPILEVHRAKVYQIWKMQEFLRGSAFELAGLDKKFLYNENYGIQARTSLELVKESFVEWYNNNKDNKSLTEKDGMIVVENSQVKDALINELKGTISNIDNFIYTLKDWKDVAINDAAGLSSENVFVYYDLEAKKNETRVGRESISMKNKDLYDVMLTAVSRAKKKAYIVYFDDIVTEYSKTVKEDSPDSNSEISNTADVLTFQKNNDNVRAKYRDIASVLGDKKGTTSVNVVLGEETGGIGNQYRSDSLNNMQIIETITKEVEKNITEKPQGEKLSSLVFRNYKAALNPQTSIKSRLIKNYIAQFNTGNLTPSQETKIADEIKKSMDELTDVLKDTSFNAGSYAKSLLEMPLPPIIARALTNGNAVSLPVLNGKAYGEDMHAIPAIISVVGEYDGKPIVDIHDVVYRLNPAKRKNTEKNIDRAESRQMMLYTIKAAIDNGYIVNNAVLSVFTDSGPNIIYSGSEYYSHEYIKSNLETWLKEDVTDIDKMLANEEIYYSNERQQSVEFGKERLYNGDKAVNIKSKIVQWVNGSYKVNYLIDDNGTMKVVSSDEFNSYKTPSQRHEERGFFKSGAEKYVKNSGALYNLTHNTITQIGGQVINRTMDEKQRDKILNQILNAHKSVAVITKLERNVKAGKETFNYVIASYFDDKILSSIGLKNGLKLSELKTEGLHFVVQHDPEYNYGKSKIQKDGVLFDKFMSPDNTTSDKALEEIKGKMNFKNIVQDGNIVESKLDDINETLVELNIKSLQLMRDLALSGNSVQSEIKEITTSIGKVSQKGVDVFLQELGIGDGVNFVKKAKVERVTVGDGFTKYALFLDKNNSDRIIGDEKLPIYFSSKQVVTDKGMAKEQTISYISSLLDGLSDVQSMIDGVFTLESKTKIKKAIKESFKAMKDTEAMQFIMQNQNVNTLFDKIYLSFAFVYNEKLIDTKRMINKSTLQGSLSTIKSTLKGLQEEIKGGKVNSDVLMNMRMPIYFNGQHQLQNMLTTARINQPGLFIKQGKVAGINNNTSQGDIVC